MAKIYARQIKRGAVSIEDVPERWRGEAEKLIKSEVIGVG